MCYVLGIHKIDTGACTFCVLTSHFYFTFFPIRCEDQLLTSDKEMEEKVTEMVKCNSELNAVQMTMVRFLIQIHEGMQVNCFVEKQQS